MSDEPTSPAPGWYPDPTAPGRQRYWDGSEWTDWTDDNYAEKTGTPAPGTGVGTSTWPTTPATGAPGLPATPGQPHPAGGQPTAWVAPTARTNGMAIGALITGIVSIVICVLTLPVGIVAGPVAIVLAVKANRTIKADPSQTGSGMATAGLVTGIIGTIIGIGLLVFWIVAISDPSFQEGFNEGFRALG